jgi:hypothetical protein
MGLEELMQVDRDVESVHEYLFFEYTSSRAYIYTRSMTLNA